MEKVNATIPPRPATAPDPLDGRGVPIAQRPTPKPRIPKRFADPGKTLATYRPQTASQAAAMETVMSWCEAVAARDGAMLALIGVKGTGKSHLLYSAAKALAEQRIAPFCRPWYSFADELRYGRGGAHPRQAAEFRADLWGAAVVMLDEVRPTSGTDFDDTELAKFSCHAYDQEIPVLITSNVSPLSLIMGEAAASRYTEVVIKGPNGREAADRG